MEDTDLARSAAARALSGQGEFASADAEFSPREAQRQMAAGIEAALANTEDWVVEAGTGIGKTYAYLVPVLQSGKRAIISTGTKALQDQLYFRDLPHVVKTLGVRTKTALLKGRANYLCHYRFAQTTEQQGYLPAAELSQLHAVKAWAGKTRFGDIAEIAHLAEDLPLWQKLTSNADNCLGGECPFIQDCFVAKARRAAQEANVVVVNHHLLFADLAIKREGFGEILPGAQAFVIDEAHQMPELSSQFFSMRVSSRQIADLEQDLLREVGAASGAKAALAMAEDALGAATKNLRLAMNDLPKKGPFGKLSTQGAAQAGQRLLRCFEQTCGTLQALSERSEGLASCLERTKAMLQRLRQFFDAPQAGWVHWYETTERGFVLSATPLDVAEPLTAFRRGTSASWIFTSATLAEAGNFNHFLAALGLEGTTARSLPSPFDYAKNALCYIPRIASMPNQGDFTEAVISATAPALAASKGRAFLLFTSHRALRSAADLLKNLPYPLFVQGQMPKGQLLDSFRRSGNGVLLGTSSFWEGVDVKGEALSLVMIDKLPFAAPDDPVLEARLDLLRQNGANPFRDYQIPLAAIALKQGIGRLIRDARDRGVLMLCDPRLLSAAYGKRFLAAMPAMPITRDLAEVSAFFQ